MPDRAALIAVFIIERPLCVSCISSKSGLTHGEVELMVDGGTGVRRLWFKANFVCLPDTVDPREPKRGH